MRISTWAAAAVFMVVASGCCRSSGKAEKELPPAATTTTPTAGHPTGATATAATATTTAAATTAAPAANAAADYPMGDLKALPETCKSPAVLFAAITVPAAEKGGYKWRYATQAMVAHPQFKVVDGAPAAPMEVHFLAGWNPAAGSLGLIGRCKDSATCNKLAAMYKAVVPTSRPQLGCSDPPFQPFADQADAPNMTKASLASALPDGSDSISQCARLAACRLAVEHTVAGDPALECQKAPSKFKISCAAKSSCTEVVACSK